MAKKTKTPQTPWLGYLRVNVTDDMLDQLVPAGDFTLSDMDSLIDLWVDMGYTYGLKFNSTFDAYEASVYGHSAECTNAGIKLSASAPTWQEANQLLVLKIGVVGLDSWHSLLEASESSSYR